MGRFRKAEALFHYALLITVVALGLATMHNYLRRSIQAKVKDLTDHVISDRQLASLSDPTTEKSTREINSTYELEMVEGVGGMGKLNTLSSYTVEMKHEAESLEEIDYGQVVPSVINPAATYVSYSDDQETQDSVSTIDGLGGIIDSNSDGSSNDDSDEGSNYGSSASNLGTNVSSSDTGTTGRGSGGGTMGYYNQESE